MDKRFYEQIFFRQTSFQAKSFLRFFFTNIFLVEPIPFLTNTFIQDEFLKYLVNTGKFMKVKTQIESDCHNSNFIELTKYMMLIVQTKLLQAEHMRIRSC